MVLLDNTSYDCNVDVSYVSYGNSYVGSDDCIFRTLYGCCKEKYKDTYIINDMLHTVRSLLYDKPDDGLHEVSTELNTKLWHINIPDRKQIELTRYIGKHKRNI